MKTIKCPNCYKDLPVSYLIMFLATTLFLILITVGICHADQLDDKQCILAIIGEAEGEGYSGMLAIAEAIRNRGNLKGVYGIKSKRVVKRLYSDEVYETARIAWEDSSGPGDITHGATHWEGSSFKTPYWAKNMKVVVRIGNQIFYK